MKRERGERAEGRGAGVQGRRGVRDLHGYSLAKRSKRQKRLKRRRDRKAGDISRMLVLDRSKWPLRERSKRSVT